jgi:predicted transcriptional regulator
MGEKKYEFRKNLARDNVSKIVVYSTAPEGKILGEVEVKGKMTMKKTLLWEQTKKHAGITREKYREYFHGCAEAHAYVLGKTTLYDNSLTLADFGIAQAPQSFVYLD